MPAGGAQGLSQVQPGVVVLYLFLISARIFAMMFLALPAAPRIATPAEAARPCGLYVLPAAPTQADLEIGYATRGAQLVACDAARRLAVQTHEAEHALEDAALGAVRKP
jgi:hypothetical protein